MTSLGIILKKPASRSNPSPQKFYDADELSDMAANLSGRKIVAVNYYDNNVTRGCDSQYWNFYGELADYIYSVELVFDNGEVLSLDSDVQSRPFTGVVWTAETAADYLGFRGANYPILESDDYLIRHFDIGTVWDVTNHSRWQNVVGVPIERVDLFFGDAMVRQPVNGSNAIIDVGIHFIGGSCIYLASGCRGLHDDKVVRPGNDLLVVFDDRRARQFAFGPYAVPPLNFFTGLAPTRSGMDNDPGLAPVISRDSEQPQ